MRKVAYPISRRYKRLMLYQYKNGIFLFYSETENDHGTCGDSHYSDIQDLYDDCLEEYGINPDDWQLIDDPLPHCQHDTIEPIRVVGRDVGKPQFGKLEKLLGGKWVPWLPDV